MQRIVFALAAVAGCRGSHEPVSAVASGSGPVAAPVLRTDRPPIRLGGELHNGRAPLATPVALEVCPGDKEVVAVDRAGWLRRIRLADGAELAATSLTARDAAELAYTEPAATDGTTWISEVGDGKLDCRNDGTAIAVGAISRTHILLGDDAGMSARADQVKIPFTVDAKGVRTRIAGTANEARFGADGAPRWVDAAGVYELRDGKPIEIVKSERAAIANRGAYFIFVPAEGERDAHTTMHLAGKSVQLPGLADFEDATVTPDGSVVASVLGMTATSWIAGGGKMKPYMLLETAHVPPVGGAKYFAAVDHNTVWDAERPRNRWDHVDGVCGEDGAITALAMTHDETRLVLGCAHHGLRVMNIDTAEIVALGEPPLGAQAIAWSPSGDLATRDEHAIEIWRSGKRIASLAVGAGTGVWWRSPSEVAAGIASEGPIAVLPVAGGAAKKLAVPGVLAPIVAGATRADVAVMIDRAHVYEAKEVAVLRAGKVDAIAIPFKKPRDDSDRHIAMAYRNRMQVCGLAISDDGSHAAVLRGECAFGINREIIALDLTAKTARVVLVTVTAAAPTADGLYVAQWGGAIAKLVNDKPQVIAQHGANVTALAVSPDRKTIAAGGADGRITLVSTAGAVLGVLDAHADAIRALTWSPDGSQLASAAADGVFVWDR
jgi:WD40 repeat protein